MHFWDGKICLNSEHINYWKFNPCIMLTNPQSNSVDHTYKESIRGLTWHKAQWLKMWKKWKTTEKKISKFLFYKMSGSKEVICPFDSCVVDRVKYLCSCGLPQPLSKLYFCRHCLDLRCGFCVLHEVDSHYCPNCLENMPSGTYLSSLFPCIVKVA